MFDDTNNILPEYSLLEYEEIWIVLADNYAFADDYTWSDQEERK